MCSDDLVLVYNAHLSHTLNQFAPLKTHNVTFLRSAPWYTPELRKLKAAGRQLERLSKKTGLTVHMQAYKDHVLAYKEALNEAKSMHYTTIIARGQGNPRALFSTVNKPTKPFPLTPSTDICCEFLNLFQNKISTIYSCCDFRGRRPPTQDRF